MSNTPSPASGTPPSVSGKSSWHSRLRESKTLSRTAPLVTNTGLLAFIAPLLQAEVGIAIWITALAGALLFLAAFIFLPDRPLLRAWFRWTFYLTVIGVIAVLAVLPFYRMPARTYVAVTGEGLSFFDPQRYISDSVILSPEAGVVIANHPAHRAVAGILYGVSHVNDPGQRWATPLRWLGGLTRNFFQGDILFLTPTARKGDRVVPVALGREHMETWTDLAGAPCRSYQFDLESETTAAYTLDAVPLQKLEDGSSRIGTDFHLRLAAKESQKLRFYVVSRQEVIQWDDVPLFTDYDNRTAIYIAELAELLNSPQLRVHWARNQAKLWASVPSDRERLRLLLLRARLDNVVADGNIFRSQLLPDLIRVETILATSVSSPEALVQDQLLYWGAKNFVRLSEHLKNRFATSVDTLKKSLKEAAPAVDPVFIDRNKLTGTDMKSVISRIVPDFLWARKGFRDYLDANFPADIGSSGDPTPIHPQLAWMRTAEWSHLKNALPHMGLQRSPLTAEERKLTAAEEARTPTLEDAWDEAETQWGMELARRILLHASPEIRQMMEGDIEAMGYLSVAVAEGSISQAAFIEDLLVLRQSLFGDRDGYLAKSDITAFLLAASRAYAQPSLQAAAPDLTSIVKLTDVMVKTMTHPLILAFFQEEGLEEDLKGFAAEPLAWLAKEPRLAKILVATASALKKPELLKEGDQILPWMEWLVAATSDPVILKVMESVDKEEVPPAELFREFEKYAKTAPTDEEGRQQIAQWISEGARFVEKLIAIDEADWEVNTAVMTGWTADVVILFRDFCYRSKVVNALGEMIDRSIYSDRFTAFEALIDPENEEMLAGYHELRTALRARLPATPAKSTQSPTEQRLWLFINRIAWYANLPEGQRPVRIVRDEALGMTCFDPPCPVLETWIREAVTADTTGPEGNAYPYVSETMLLDMILRTLEDDTPNGYVKTEFGGLRQLFETLTRQSIESYLADCVQSAGEVKPAPAAP